jgi:peroxiredoxin Q/BCP
MRLAMIAPLAVFLPALALFSAPARSDGYPGSADSAGTAGSGQAAGTPAAAPEAAPAAEPAAAPAAEPAAPALAVGQPAPAFDLAATTGKNISLKQYEGKKTVVLYFYPKDETPGCTKEACDFRDHSKDLDKAGVVVLGVSNDDLKSHQGFKAHYKLPFPLLSDPDAKVSKLYGVYKTQSYNGKEWTGIERTTFVIGKDGRIAQIWPKVKVDGHVDEVLKFVAKS